MDTFQRLTLGEYWALCKIGAPKAIPTMTINLLPLCAKSWIVVLGNHEDWVWSKFDRFAPVLCSDSLIILVSLAVERRRTLKKGNVKNMFCNGVLPPEEVTIVHPLLGGPSSKPNKFWLLNKTL